MNRLTNKKFLDVMLNFPKDYIFSNEELAYYKLCQYEDIEEELGIDLITLNKLRKADKIYVMVLFCNEPQEFDRFKIDLRECKILYGYIKGKGYCLQQPLSNYNKGFSLSKEELENEYKRK